MALLVSLTLVAACAIIEMPPGGPIDTVPPHLAIVSPDSGSTGLGEVDVLVLTFSEKMDRRSAITWLHFFPDQRIKSTKWHGATEAEITLEEPLPPDTVIVVEIAGGMKDAHKVTNKHSRRYPIATADSISGGTISGVLIMADSTITNGVVELYGLQPDSLDYFQRPLERRTVTDGSGKFVFDWLPVPGGPWIMRAFTDPDFNLRPGERDAQRLLPDTLSVTAAEPDASAGVVTMYAYGTPGRLLAEPFVAPDAVGQVMAWTLAISDADTGWTPAPAGPPETTFYPLWPDSGGVLQEVEPGLNRVIAFVDVDGDSTFSAVPDSLLGVGRDSLTASVVWYLEPWGLREDVEIEPGLPAWFVVPALGDSLVTWAAPEPDLPDSTATALADSLTAAADSLFEATVPAEADTSDVGSAPEE